jgi:hypothetical protein
MSERTIEDQIQELAESRRHVAQVTMDEIAQAFQTLEPGLAHSAGVVILHATLERLEQDMMAGALAAIEHQVAELAQMDGRNPGLDWLPRAD